MDITIGENPDLGFSLRPKDDKFKFEVNLGLALPSKFRVSKEFDRSKEFVSLVKSVAEDGSVGMLKIKTQSNKGPLGGFDNDVLTVLLSMAWEQRERNLRNGVNQNGYRVYYTLYEICRRLGLKEGSAIHVSESISKISSQNLVLNNFIYKSDEKKAIKNIQETKIILKKGRVTVADGVGEMDDYTSFFYVEFDSNVISNLYSDYVSVLNSSKYLSLKSGPYRRIYVFLTSKKKNFGCQYVFSLSELSQVLGLEESPPRKQREFVGQYLKKVSEELKSFKYVIQKEKGKNAWTVLIQHFDQVELLPKEHDPFYAALIRFYGQEKLDSLQLQEVDILNIKEEFENKYRAEKENVYFSFQNEQINAAEFVLDIALFQVLRRGYRLTSSFKALAKHILKVLLNNHLEIPEKYRYFLYKRIEQEDRLKEKEVLLIEKKKRDEKKEEEKKKLEQAFLDFYRNIVMKNKGQMSRYKEKAELEIQEEGTTKDDMMFGLLVDTRIESLARRDFDNGNVLNMAKNGNSVVL